jgi:SP family xylose:H+ symportor-like MFS transporter
MAGLGMSFGPIVWILMSEIFPAPIRAQAMATSIAAQWGANFLVSFTFPILFDESGYAFWLYGAFGLLAAYVVLHYVPETKGVDNTSLGTYWRKLRTASR